MPNNITPAERQLQFKNILKLQERIDNFLNEKGDGGAEKFKLVSVGHEMMRLNSNFYESGVRLGDESFSTLATESENKRDLAMSFLTVIYSNWIYHKKTNFDVLEVGAGSGDLMKEIFTIRDEVMASDSSSEQHKNFFRSLKFNIVDFAQMIQIQKEKLGKYKEEVKFIEHDISKNLLPSASYDFVYGNEIPDTQRVDFLEIKTDKATGEKKYFLRGLKTSESCETKEVLVNITNFPLLIDEIEKNIYPIAELKDGVYKLQFGFHALMHNINQSLKPSGSVLLTDYFDFKEDLSRKDLAFAGADGSSFIDITQFIEIQEPGMQLIEAKKCFGGFVDVTYSPNVGSDTCKLFGVVATALGKDDRSKAILSLKIKEEDVGILESDVLFGANFKEFVKNFEKNEVMKKELSPCESLRKLVEIRGVTPIFKVENIVKKQIGLR